jgi:outer membrane protein assembly factor BamA
MNSRFLFRVLLGVWLCTLYGYSFELRFAGNQSFSSSQLSRQLELPQDFAELSEYRQSLFLFLAQENLASLYLNSGYFDVEIRFQELQDSTQSPPSRIFEYTIREGQSYTFGEVILNAPEAVVKLIQERNLSIIRQKNYRYESISQDVQYIYRELRNQGYLHVRVRFEESLDTLAKEVDVRFDIEPGKQVIMGDIILLVDRGGVDDPVRGFTQLSTIENLLNTPKGTIINGSKLSDLRSKLLSTQLYSQVYINDSIQEDSHLSDIHIYLTERTPGVLRASLFYENLYGFGISGQLQHKNIGGLLHEGAITGFLAPRKQEIGLGYANPLLFGTGIRFEDRLILNHELVQSIVDRTQTEYKRELINKGTLTYRFNRSWWIRGATDLRYVNRSNDEVIKFKVEATPALEYTDRIFNPTQGWNASLTFGQGGEFAWDRRYLYSEAQVNVYLRILNWLRPAISLNAGTFFSEGLWDDAENYFQGGPRTVRGFNPSTIHPYGVEHEGQPVTPRFVRISSELRMNTPYFGLDAPQSVLFYDWTRVSDVQLEIPARYEDALGFGLRFRWQLVTLRLDYTLMRSLHKQFKIEPFKWVLLSFDLSQTF